MEHQCPPGAQFGWFSGNNRTSAPELSLYAKVPSFVYPCCLRWWKASRLTRVQWPCVNCNTASRLQMLEFRDCVIRNMSIDSFTTRQNARYVTSTYIYVHLWSEWHEWSFWHTAELWGSGHYRTRWRRCVLLGLVSTETWRWLCRLHGTRLFSHSHNTLRQSGINKIKSRMRKIK